MLTEKIRRNGTVCIPIQPLYLQFPSNPFVLDPVPNAETETGSQVFMVGEGPGRSEGGGKRCRRPVRIWSREVCSDGGRSKTSGVGRP